VLIDCTAKNEEIRKAANAIEEILNRFQTRLSEARHSPQQANHTDLFSLIPGRYPNAVSLPSVIASLPNTPQGRQIIQMLVDMIQTKLGIPLPSNIVNEIFANTYRLLNYLKGSPTFLHDIWNWLNMAGLPPVNETMPRIPSGFVFPDDIATFPLNTTLYIPSIAPIVPNATLWLGWFMPNTTTLDQAKINIIMSLVLNQLSDNLHLTPQDSNWFTVVYKGKSFYRSDAFLREIVNTPGATFQTYVTKRIAAFFGLYQTDAQGKFFEVADPLMIDTGLYDKTGLNEAILPAIHSEYVIDVTVGSTAFNLVWYEGDDGIGYFPGNMYLLESWVGTANGSILTGETALKAILYMDIIRDVFIQIAVKNNLWDRGYGITGVCDDSCGIIEIVTTGASTEYPNLMQKSFVVPEIMYRIQKHDEMSPFYYELLRIVNALPVDWTAYKDSTARARALGTIVWPAGREPFQCVVDARAILDDASPISL